MTDKAFFDYSRFDYTRFDVYLPHFDLVIQKLEALTRGQGSLDSSIACTCYVGYFRVGEIYE